MPLIIERTFDSFEEFNSFPHGWDADFRVTTNESYVATLKHAAAEGVLVNSCSYSHSTLQQASTPPGMRSIALPIRIDGPMTWYHHEIDQHSLMVFGENRELFSVSSSFMHIPTLSVADALFERQLEQVDAANPHALRDGRVSQIDPQQWQHLHHCLDTLSAFCEKYQNDDNKQLEQYLVEETTYQFINAALGKKEGGYRIPVHAAAKHSRRAMQYIMPRLRHPLTVAEVCQATGIGRRNLELSFRRYIGLSPKQIIKQMRFAACREELVKSPGMKVSAIAEAWGFWHMGQFSRDYKALFGELPSETMGSRR